VAEGEVVAGAVEKEPAVVLQETFFPGSGLPLLSLRVAVRVIVSPGLRAKLVGYISRDVPVRVIVPTEFALLER
jgi:hypothetical protein